jgi:hypothetical protein
VAAQHGVLVPEYQQLSILRQVPAEDQHGQAGYPANEQVDDLEQHPAQPTISASSLLATAPVSHAIDYSSGTGSVSSSASARIWKLGHGQRHMQLRHLA